MTKTTHNDKSTENNEKASYIIRQELINEKSSAYTNEMSTTGGNKISQGN